MKLSFISTLTILAILGLFQPAKAFNIEACAKAPITNRPQAINLLQPIDQKLLNCVPQLSSIANKWQSQAKKISSALGKLKIGNNGSSRMEKLEYNLAGNYISLVASAKASHTWKIKECMVPRMVTTYRTVKECALPKLGGGCYKWVEAQVPSGVKQDGCNKWLEKPISASATCTYNYTFNISTGESKPVFSCGRGALGEYKVDASAVTAVLRGEMPTMGSLLNSISITPPLFKDNTRDEYQNVRNDMLSKHSGSIVYFSSEAFVNWASAENQGVNIIASALSGGSYSAELMRQIEQRLRTELTYMGTFASQTAIQLGSEQIISMMTGKGSMKLNNFDVSVKVVNTPKIIQKCMVQPRQDCLPEIKSPRLGFAIIATPVQ
ncbi:hypothetical protein ACN4EK_31430 [Pantanalinema rosaneae CENA516]|uniref:hypothetical protein n=1 Tax=Pantanalinema rosaneae TaxID=1620701 RepID=UPI003D6F82E3